VPDQATKPRSRNAIKQARYRRRQKTNTIPEWVDAGERTYEALALMPGGDDRQQLRANLSALLELGAAWYIASVKKSVTR
jgi:hypothetical protein